jgi:hypothetical protein
MVPNANDAAEILRQMTVRLRAARRFTHREYPTSFEQVARFREHARQYIQEFGEERERDRFDGAWHDAFLLPPPEGRAEKADAMEGGVGLYHPRLARIALRTLIGVMRRVEHGLPDHAPEDMIIEEPGRSTIAAAAAPAPAAPRISSWSELEIRFLSDERIELIVGSQRQTLNYAEFGLEDRRKKRTYKLAWVMLRGLAQTGGTIRYAPDGEQWPNVEKRIQEIRERLRQYFALNDDPIPFVSGTGYRTRFQISRAPSFDS